MYHIHYNDNGHLIILYYCINNERIACKKATKVVNRGLDSDQCFFFFISQGESWRGNSQHPGGFTLVYTMY